MHPRQKGQAFGFDAVLLLAGAALSGQLRWQLKPKAKIRLQPGRGQLLQLRDQLQIQAAAIALISGR